MFYCIYWYVDHSTPKTVRESLLGALADRGINTSGVGHYPGSICLDAPFLIEEGSILKPPYLSLKVHERSSLSKEIRVHLDASIGLLCGEHGQDNLRMLIEIGETIYNSIHPTFGFGHDHTYEQPTLDEFLETGSPTTAQFVYIGPSLVSLIHWGSVRTPYIRTSLPDGGLRIENPWPGLPSLDL